MLLDTSLYTRIVTGQAPRINWAHPLARDLRIVVLYGRVSSYSVEFIQPFRNTLQNTPNPNAYPNTSRSYSPKYGPGLNNNNGTAGFTQAYQSIASSTKSTAVFIGKLSSSTTATYLTGVFNTFVNGYHVADSFGGVAGNVGLNAFIGSGYITSPTSVTVDTTNVHCIATSNAGTGASNTIKLFVDGVLRDTWSPGANPGFGGSAFRDATPAGGRHNYVQMIFARELSILELQALQENPYQIFVPNTSVTLAKLTSTAVTLSADSGAYNLTGSAAELLKAQSLSADSGAYNLTGAPAELLKISGVTLPADSGSYSLVGSDATLNITRILSADSGAYNLTGSSADLPINRSLSADSGAYNVTGAAATLTQAKVISADAGSYALDGQAASFIRTYNLLAAAGAFNLTGSDATLSTAKTLSAGVGSYNLTGLPASLTKFSIYPDPGDVREGVVYGPGGIYVGTLKVGGKILFIFDD